MIVRERPAPVTIRGDLINDIHSFYQQINILFMQEEDWKIAESLDALDDLFYGSYGILKLHPKIDIVWRNHHSSERALGRELTRNYYLSKLEPGSHFNKPFFQQQIAELDAGRGVTYFDKIVEIIRSHKNISLFLV